MFAQAISENILGMFDEELGVKRYFLMLPPYIAAPPSNNVL